MRPFGIWIPVVFLATLLTAIGCGSNGSKKDGGKDAGAFDAPAVPDGYTLWPCDTPGQSCNAHDPCAIDPVCGSDKRCYPSRLQNCDDGLDCTQDICKGMGLCDHVPKEGACSLPVKVGGSADGGTGGTTEIQCFNKGDKNPEDECQVCEPEENKTSWTGANGGACNDGNDCTKDDYCQAGECKGVYYGTQCADQYGCTEDICDGKGGCKGNELKSDWCLINGVCYQDGANHPGGACSVCDVSKSQSEWTAITNTCMIDNKCYQNGAKHPGQCAECDPAASTSEWTVKGDDCLIQDTCYKPGAKDDSGCGECAPGTSKSAWTPVKDHCLIGTQCYKDQTKDATGCLICDYAKSPTAWTPVAGAKTVVYDFETGKATGWTLSPPDGTVGWTVTDKRPSGGKYSLYYGDPAAGNYDTSGTANTGSASMPAITPTTGKKAGISFMLFMDTESGTSYDTLEVYVGADKVWEKTTTTVPTMGVWQEVTIDLSKYAGQSIVIKFEFNTQDSVANSSEGTYIDDITIYDNC